MRSWIKIMLALGATVCAAWEFLHGSHRHDVWVLISAGWSMAATLSALNQYLGTVITDLESRSR